MNAIKRILGIVWILIGIYAVYYLIVNQAIMLWNKGGENYIPAIKPIIEFNSRLVPSLVNAVKSAFDQKPLFKLYEYDDINDEYLTPINKIKQIEFINNIFSKSTRQSISTITFAQNCIIIVKKTDDEYDKYNNRVYCFEKNL